MFKDSFQPENDRYKNSFQPSYYPLLRTSLAFQRKLLKALEDGGVPLLCGTDASTVGPVAGFGVHDELQEFVNDGLTPFQALETATSNPAKYFRANDQWGTIQAGKRADFVLLAGNPLADIANTRKIEGIVLQGKWLDGKTLQQELQRVPAEYQARIQEMEKLLQKSPEQANTLIAEMDPYAAVAATALQQLTQGQDGKAVYATLARLSEALLKSQMLSEDAINDLGYQFVRKQKYDQAIAALRWNTEHYPKSANAWDSLAEAIFKSGNVPQALEGYRKALEVDPKYPNAEVARKFIQEHSPAQ